MYLHSKAEVYMVQNSDSSATTVTSNAYNA